MTHVAPIPRKPAYDLYWQFAAKRQAIFEKRLNGDAAPWTDDPILETYKFCNVYRATDRVSQYLIREICYSQEPCTPEDKLFQIVAFRFFSKESTWDAIREYLGRSPLIQDLADNQFAAALEHARQINGTIYTNAFILCAADAYGQGRKHLNHIALFRDMFLVQDYGYKLRMAGSLQEIFHLLRRLPLIGNFMAYQIAVDLNYSDIINFSENGFTVAGPGALRGIAKVFESTGGLSPAEVIQWMVTHQDEEFARLGLTFRGLNGRKLHAIDCQGLFCETDKYCRVALPELASARKRIKTKYGTSTVLKPLVLPPKWGV